MANNLFDRFRTNFCRNSVFKIKFYYSFQWIGNYHSGTHHFIWFVCETVCESSHNLVDSGRMLDEYLLYRCCWATPFCSSFIWLICWKNVHSCHLWDWSRYKTWRARHHFHIPCHGHLQLYRAGLKFDRDIFLFTF